MTDEQGGPQKSSVKDSFLTWWGAKSAEGKRNWALAPLLVVAILVVMISIAVTSPTGTRQSSRGPGSDLPEVEPYLFGGGRSNIRAIEEVDRVVRSLEERIKGMEDRQGESLERLNRVRENFEGWISTTDVERAAITAQRRMDALDAKLRELEQTAEDREFAQAGITRFDPTAPASAPGSAGAGDGEPTRIRPEPPSPQPEPSASGAPQDLFSGTGLTPRNPRRAAAATGESDAEPAAEQQPPVRTGLRINGRSLAEMQAEADEVAAELASVEAAGDGASDAQATPTATRGDNIDSSIPVASIMSAVLIHGMDAPTGTGARGQPVPVIARITDLSILPNIQSMDLVDCHILVAAYGDLSSERAMGRTEDLSCTRADGEIIHSKVSGYIVGPDGKVGVRGPVIHRNGELVVRSIQSGVLSGLGQMFGGRRRGLTISTTGRMAEQDWGEAAEEGIGRGVGTAMENISRYYLDLAESIFPVINVDPGTPIDIVVTGQVDLNV